jgi:hypothetical protein
MSVPKKARGKMSKEQTIKVHDPIFRQTFLLYCNYEFSVFYKEVLGEEYGGDCGVVSGYCINTDHSEICIWLKDYNDIPSLIHELQHAMQYALYDRCYVDRRESELPSYYMEFLSREFLCKYKEIGNNNEN